MARKQFTEEQGRADHRDAEAIRSRDAGGRSVPTNGRQRAELLPLEKEVRRGYRRLTVLLRREGWKVNPKRIYRLYSEAGLTVTRPIQWPRLFLSQPFSRGAIMSQVRPSEAAIFNTENRFVPTMLTLDRA